MSDDIAIRFEHVGKMYKAFGSKRDNVVDALNVPFLRGRSRYREFWALRDIDLEVPRGARLGVIGRNGAGKSTLLKLITRNIDPTEGRITVQGDVQALLEIGGGLHPEFTGRENIRAALGYMGLSRSQIDDAEVEIVGFTELGRFLDQPFRTYSQGMQARLSFAIGTTVRPEILIVDEILGAGDAYFFARSTERMRKLIEGGATVLLVAHALDHVVRFCDETIWLDRGRIVMRGSSIEAVKAYERFTRELDARRRMAVNGKASWSQTDAFERESYTDTVSVEFPAQDGLDIRGVSLLRDGTVEDAVAIGDAQDTDPGHAAAVVEEASWSAPKRAEDTFFRSVAGPGAAVEFQLWFFFPTSEYALDLSYRAPSGARVDVRRQGQSLGTFALPPSETWTTHRVGLPHSHAEQADEERPRSQRPGVSRWPGEGSLRIDKVELLDDEETETALLHAGKPMRLRLHVTAERAGLFSAIPVAVIYRLDGVLVTSHTGSPLPLELGASERCTLELDFGPLNLGNGQYVFSVALYRTLSHLDGSEAYDLIDRSYEFEVAGNPPLRNGIFTHPATWRVVGEPGERNVADASAADVA